MASNSTTFGATIVRPFATQTTTHISEPLTDSPSLTPAVSRDGPAPDYLQPTAKTPLYAHSLGSDLVKSHSSASSNIKDAIAVFEKDVESGNLTPFSATDDENPFGRNVRVSSNKEDEMWPSKQTLKQKQKDEKRLRRDTRGCAAFRPARDRWSALTKKQKVYAKIIMAALLVGVAVALGVGISVAVKGSYYVADGSNKTVG